MPASSVSTSLKDDHVGHKAQHRPRRCYNHCLCFHRGLRKVPTTSSVVLQTDIDSFSTRSTSPSLTKTTTTITAITIPTPTPRIYGLPRKLRNLAHQVKVGVKTKVAAYTTTTNKPLRLQDEEPKKPKKMASPLKAQSQTRWSQTSWYDYREQRSRRDLESLLLMNTILAW